jgi:hypothetical protein
MSAAQNFQNHPVYKQASSQAKYYHDQLDKEVSIFPLRGFERTRQPYGPVVTAPYR